MSAGYAARAWPPGVWKWAVAWVDKGSSPAGNPGPYLQLPRVRDGEETTHRIYPRWWGGDVLWVREAFSPHYFDDGRPAYRADWTPAASDVAQPPKWKPGIHMPHAVCRLRLVVVSVRPERVQDIDEADAQREGVAPRHTGRFRMAVCQGCGTDDLARENLRCPACGSEHLVVQSGSDLSHRAAFEAAWRSMHGDESLEPQRMGLARRVTAGGPVSAVDSTRCGACGKPGLELGEAAHPACREKAVDVCAACGFDPATVLGSMLYECDGCHRLVCTPCSENGPDQTIACDDCAPDAPEVQWTDYLGPVFLHASKRRPTAKECGEILDWALVAKELRASAIPSLDGICFMAKPDGGTHLTEDARFGRVLGVATIGEREQYSPELVCDGIYPFIEADRPVAWHLSDVHPIEPGIPWKGGLGLRKARPELIAEVERSLAQ